MALGDTFWAQRSGGLPSPFIQNSTHLQFLKCLSRVYRTSPAFLYYSSKICGNKVPGPESACVWPWRPGLPQPNAVQHRGCCGKFWGWWRAAHAPPSFTLPASLGTTGYYLCSLMLVWKLRTGHFQRWKTTEREMEREGRKEKESLTRANIKIKWPLCHKLGGWQSGLLMQLRYLKCRICWVGRLIPFMLQKVFHDIKGFICLLICFRLRRPCYKISRWRRRKGSERGVGRRQGFHPHFCREFYEPSA